MIPSEKIIMQYSIVNYSEVAENTDFRLAAEYYHPLSLEIHRKIKNNESISFFDCITKFSSGKNLPQVEVGNFKFIRTQNIKPILVNENGMSYTNSLDELTEIVELRFVRVGGVSNSSVVTPNSVNSTVSDNVLRIKIRKLNPFFVCSFFNSTVGQIYFRRVFKGTAQGLISRENFRDIFIPQFSQEFQSLIERLCLKVDSLHKQSSFEYHDAQALLLSELGLTDWQPKHQLTFVKNFSDTQHAERFDADYFQPKYDEIEKGIENYSNKPTKVRDEFKQNKSTFEVDPEKLYRYVEIGSVNVSTGAIVAEEVLGKDLPANAKRVLKKGDVIVSKVRTYRGAITIIQEDGYVGSGAFCVLRENGQINKETLLACLRSKLFLTWSWKPNTGTSYPTLSDDDILNFSIPILPKEKQTKIKQKVDESFNLRTRAKNLLECAKRAVEIAIEQDEQTATEWLESVS